ncbi:MAG: hypothetical protein M3P24_01860 [Gemmatimonadota bacterium]|nr:hypothetical protein [Gemmatimonadota bacterium]
MHLSTGGEGELVRDKFYYNAGIQLSRRTVDTPSLLAGPDVLRMAGISPDSVRKFLAALAAAGIPPTLGTTPSSRTSDDVLFLGRLDHTPNSERTWGITAYGRLTHSDVLALTPTSTPAHATRSSAAVASVQGMHSRHIRKYYLNETKTALTLSVDRTVPSLRAPGGQVLVSGSPADRTGGLALFSFGGNPADRDARSWTWEAVNETQWHNWNNEHRFKLHVQSRLDGYTRTDATNRLGTFTYNSLDDLTAGRPATLTRALNTPMASGGRWNGVLALGDTWRRSAGLQVLYGVRLEANRFLRAPTFNPAVLEAFGVRNDRRPDAIHLSPRLGFTWAYLRPGENPGFSAGALGTRYHTPVGVLRGGIGEFRGQLPAELLHGALLSTGLPGAYQHLHCVGTAVPHPDWRSFMEDLGTLPARCLEEGGAPRFADTAPFVELFDAGYAAPRSWRGNLAWSSRYRRIGLTVQGIYSLNLNQPSTINLNFAGASRFVLPDEGNRPVFARISDIVPATGHVAPAGARHTPAFGPVLSRRSDLRSESRQFILTATPSLPFNQYFLSLSYALSSTRAQFRGSDGAASGDPTDVERAPGNFDARHQFQVQAGWARPWMSVTLFGRLTSGIPFTPITLGDVNGDGIPGDRAFVFDPATVHDPALAVGMRSLLAEAPRWARDCLTAQLGRVADRNGCRGPWTHHLNVRVAFGGTTPGGGSLRDRMKVALAWKIHSEDSTGPCMGPPVSVAGAHRPALTGYSTERGDSSPPRGVSSTRSTRTSATSGFPAP